MLTSKPTKKMIDNWKKIYDENKSLMQPNSKSGEELNAYFKSKYDFEECGNLEYGSLIKESIITNKFYKEKVVDESKIEVKVYKKSNVIVGIEMQTGYFQVESEDISLMESIYDNLFLYRGLDKYDLKNYFVTAQYIILSRKQK